LIVAAVADPDADAAMMNAPAAMDDAVIDDVVVGRAGRRRRFVPPTATDPHAARAEVVQPTALDLVGHAAAVQPDAAQSHVSTLPTHKLKMARAIRLNDATDTLFRLPVSVTALGQHVLAVLETQSAERQVFHKAALLRLALKRQEPLCHRRPHFSSCHVLTRQWPVKQRTVPHQNPLARRVQGFPEVFQSKTLIGSPLEKWPRRAPAEVENRTVDIKKRGAMPGHLPGVIYHDSDIRQRGIRHA